MTVQGSASTVFNTFIELVNQILFEIRLEMAPYVDLQESANAITSHLDGQAVKDPANSVRYWRELFHSIGPQPRLSCFSLEHTWPRPETTLTAPDGLLDKALEFCRTHHVRLDDLIYTVWASVSVRHIAGDQAAVVFTIAGREASTFRYGDTVNGQGYPVFPLVLSVPENIDAISWVRHVGRVKDDSATHAYIGHGEILDAASASQPQVKISINFDNASQEIMTADDSFPLVLNIGTSPELKLSMRHDAGVPRADIRILLDHFAATLQHMIKKPQSNISSLDIMSLSERQLLHDYGKAALKPRSGLIHSLVEEQAKMRPDANAVQFEMDAPLTYSMLNKRSNQLACQLRQYNASYIPVHMRISSNFIVTLLAILKAGAAYVILDPEAPSARKSFIMGDVNASFVLVDESTTGQLSNEFNVKTLLDQSLNNDESDNITDQSASSPAYIIYTSGSTGKPKAVLLEHQAAFNGLRAFPKVEGLRQLLFSNPIFSATQRSIWATLSVGGCLCLASKENLTVHTARTINNMEVNSVDMTSSAAILIKPDSVPSLRRIVLGGEMVSPSVIQTWAHRVELLSSYGLSECTQLNWRYALQNDTSPRIIGQPFDTTTSYILTPGTTDLSPLLVPGELCLGGSQLARGYLNKSQETEKQFIDNPFGKGRLYRTGDIAVRHADGSVELIGRIDFQVKINGQKVDPGEPNSIIQTHKGVKQSVVVPALVNSKLVLVAVVVSHSNSDWESLVADLRLSLSIKLPLYMIPSFWVTMSELPLNSNGKVDMSAIRYTVESLSQSGQLLPERPKNGLQEYDFTDNEIVIRRLWAKVLSIAESEISLQDSFISLGGTSLEVIQVVSQLQSEHSLRLRVEDIILGESLSQVAQVAQQQFEGKADHQPAPFALLKGRRTLETFGMDMSEVEDAYPVTPFQEAAIANTMMGGTSYIYSRSYSFDGYSHEAIKDALITLMRSERNLRTTFVPEGISFLQVVQKTADIPWETSELEVEEYMHQQISKSMQVGELWWKAAVLRENVLVITVHHALFDYWSNEFLLEDLNSLLLGAAPVQRPAYSRYIEYLQHQDDGTMRNFWNRYLDGAVSSKLGSNSAPENIVTAEVSHDLKSTASNLKVTPSVLLYAAWAIVLSSVCCTDDVVMGVTLSGRDVPVSDILHMSGPTLLIAPLRVKVNKSSSLADHMRSVQSSLWEIAKHAQYGLRNILKASGQPKELFDTMANFLIKMPSHMHRDGLKALPESNLGTVEYTKLELQNASLNRVTLCSTLEPEYAQGLVDSVADILKAACDRPLTVIGALNLMQSVAKSTNVYDPNLQAAEHPNPQSGIREKKYDDPVLSLKSRSEYDLAQSALQRMAITCPSKTAVEDYSGRKITYAGLSIKINQLAQLLREKGVVLEQIVPMTLEKSINSIVAMFGILVAGGAFLPLGPENPRERNLGILEDSESTIVITDRLNAKFFNDTKYEIVVIDDVEWDTIPITRQVVPGLKPDCLAYVIYTSGSTGKPKGTLISHGAITAALEGILHATAMDNSRRILWSLNYTFDGSYYPLFPTLATGRTLCVAPQNTILSNLAEIINSMRVDQTNLTPTMAGLLHPDDVPTLKILATGGEPVTPHMLTVWAPRIKVYTSYGPTEATICVTTRIVTPDMNIRNVGTPFPKTTALILDPDTMEPVEPSDVGELCITGPQLARGYLNRPDATNKAFHDQPGQRFYRTGDLAKLLPSGEIELFGRKDDQVKINGHRMELGEIETVIMETDIFSQCAIIAATVLKKKQLVAFYSTSVNAPGEKTEGAFLLPPRHGPSVDQVKEQITKLPNYMIPSIWLPVSRLPVLASGKTDRKKLIALAEDMDDGVLKKYLPAEEGLDIGTEAEFELQSLWSALFQIPGEEIHANSTFHALGGDSIAALNLGSLLRRKGYNIQMNDILSSPTLRQQAALMVKQQNFNANVAADTVQQINYQPTDMVYERLAKTGISTNDVEDIYPCSPGQIEFLTQGNKEEQFWQLMAVRTLSDDFDFDRWVYLTTKLTRNNSILRTLYLYTDEDDPQTAVQVVLKHPVLNLEYRSYSTEEEKQKILESEWEHRFDPAKPFIRYTLLVNSEDGTKDLATKLDHASYDGTLLHIFDDQFKALNQGLPIPKHTPFKDFISHVMNIPKEPQLEYWTSLLQDDSFDYPSSVVDPRLSNVEVAKIGSSTGINELATSTGVTAPIVFQTAYSLLLAHLSGSSNVVYDNLVTGRNVAIDNPQLINGNCANFLPFHCHVAVESPIQELLMSTQSAFWTSTENGLVSLSEIYEALGRDRSTAAAKSLFCFQPFEPVQGEEDHMRWIVMKMSKNRMNFNYALQMEVVKGIDKGEYVLRFGYDERAFTNQDARKALDWYVGCLNGMVKGSSISELGV
ncbi:Condensation domain protein [Aspergillus sclerotialis]|uniref:Condensation domain protein n=1 Tax=Aspergillus sclerotialis TaxID=2070753 RepID=A0A3A3A3E0_9EURO|nr:Condensation domain protein [Aspergillus sclerotialis]